jgi:hypothetical protein
MGSLARMLNLEPQETGKLAFLWLLYLLFTAASQLGDGVNQALFLKRVGVEYLPYMFVVKAVLDVVMAVVYVPLAARLGHPRTLKLILIVAGVGALALWLPARQDLGFSYPLLYGFLEAVVTLLKIHWGVLLLDCYSQEAARRAFPLIYTGARVGAIAGGLILGPLARPLGPPNLLPICGGLYLATAGLALGVDRHVRSGDMDERTLARESAAGRVTHLRRGLSIGLRVPLLRAIALSTAAMVLCRYGLRYLYSAAFAGAFGEAELAAFYGLYMAAANGLSILVQALVTSRLLVHAGVTLTNLLYAGCVLGVYLSLGFWPGLVAAVVARLMENELKAAIKTPLSNLFYGALPADQRAAGRAFNLGLIVPIFTVIASLVLATAAGVRAIPWWGGVLAVLFVLGSVVQNRSYRRARAAAREEATTTATATATTTTTTTTTTKPEEGEEEAK